MYFDEKVVVIQWSSDQYWLVVCNADGSAIWWWSSTTTPYTMLAYYDTTDLTYNYEYYAEAIPGTLITSVYWRCFRVQYDKSWNFISKKWAWIAFNNLWDEVSIKSLSYN